jgi:hypothetical protein
MSPVTTDLVVTHVGGFWQGRWTDGYRVTLVEAEVHGVSFKALLRVEYQDAYVDQLAVDLASAPSRQLFSTALAARNGAAPVLWDLRLGDFYAKLQEAQPPSHRPVPTGTPAPLAPPLPSTAQLAPTLADGAAPWVEAYIGHSVHWSPRGAQHFHQAVALWNLSTVAAGRLAVELGHPIYSNLNIAMVARSTLFAKTTTAKIGTRALRQARCGHLLAPQRSTPQALHRRMSGAVPEAYGEQDSAQQLAFVQRVAFAAQQGWFYEEWGGMLHQMTRQDSPMAEFHRMLRWMDDGEEDAFESDTIARGLERANQPYLAMLCNATPHDLAPFMRPGAPYWHDGFWPRFAFITPLDGEGPSRRRQPEGLASLPSALLTALQTWHQRLGVPKATVTEIEQKGKGTGRYKAQVEPLPCQTLLLAPEVRDAYYAYNDALLEMVIDGKVSQDLDASYGRFHAKALRIAMLLASLAESRTIALTHWAYAQQVTETWRLMLHQLVQSAASAMPLTREEVLEEKIEAALNRHGALTARQLSRCIKGYAMREIDSTLAALTRAERLTAMPHGKTRHYALPGDTPTAEPQEVTYTEEVPF